MLFHKQMKPEKFKVESETNIGKFSNSTEIMEAIRVFQEEFDVTREIVNVTLRVQAFHQFVTVKNK